MEFDETMSTFAYNSEIAANEGQVRFRRLHEGWKATPDPKDPPNPDTDEFTGIWASDVIFVSRVFKLSVRDRKGKTIGEVFQFDVTFVDN